MLALHTNNALKVDTCYNHAYIQAGYRTSHGAHQLSALNQLLLNHKQSDMILNLTIPTKKEHNMAILKDTCYKHSFSK